ncbi:MAG TPA: TonB-dependent receptor [Candidatus Angelobacter sp.]
MRLSNLVGVMLVGAMLSGVAYAQGAITGDIRGTVTDPSGAVIASGTITAIDLGKGAKRTTTSGSDGTYLLPGLPPADYSVSVAKSGFQTEIVKRVTVNVGETTAVDFHMKISQVSEQVEVTAEAPLVETDKGAQENVINQRQIEDLPINRRDYLTFAQLVPEVSDSTRMANDQDFRVKQTPQSGLSIYGGNGRGNSVTVDGGEANDDSGGVRLTVSQEAVQEFQINRGNYGADLGGASGANINIVTKSGANTVHGSVFGFFRDSAMDARDPFAVTQALQPGQAFNPALPDVEGTATKDTLSRQQYGGSIGFPIRQDKSFLFLAFEGLRQNAQNAVPLLTNTQVFRPDNGQFSGNNQIGIITGLASLGATPVPCLTGQPALPAATCAAILQNILTINPATSPLSHFLVNQFENNGGLFSYTTREYLASGRFDHQFSDRNQMSAMFSFAHDNEQNPDVQSLVGFSAGSSVRAFDDNLSGSWFHQFSPKTLNDLHVQFNYTDFNVIPNEPGEVGLSIPGFANLGTNIFLPSFTIMRRPEIGDNMTWIRGHHTMKFGGDFIYRGNHTESHTFFPGRFVFGNLPGGILSPCMQVPAACGLPVSTTPAVLNGLQSASLGLPQFYQQGFGSPTYNYPRPFTSFYWQDQWAMTPNFNLTFGVRYELDSQYGALKTDKKNFAPRVSFAWDPFKDHKTAIRGGFGIFYAPIYGQIADVVQTLGLVNGNQQIAQVFVPLTGEPGNPALTSAAIFQTLFAQPGNPIACTTPTAGNAACITPAMLSSLFGINISHNGTAPLSVFFSGQPNYKSPYSMQGSLGVEREVSKGFSISASGIYVRTLHLPTAIDVNDLPTTPFTTANSPFTTGPQQVTFQNWGAPQCAVLVNNPCFANLLVLQADQYSSAASSLYYGGVLEVKKRFSDHFTLFGNYTWSRATDDSTDFNSDFGPVNNTDLAAERGLSTFDQRHKLVAAAVITGTKRGLLSGFQLSPIVKYNSGHPFDILAAGTDINGDRHSTNDRPLGIGRNTGQGPDYSDVDLRLTRSFKVGEHGALQFVAEAFNLFNRTNFASVNNEVPTFGGFADPSKVPANLSGTFLNPQTISPGGAPGAFTSALPRRQLQLGARFTF